MMKVVNLKSLGLLSLVAIPSLVAAQSNDNQRPNILFIMVDEMRSDVMHCAGDPMVKTPNLDRLAAEGIRFSNSFTVAPISGPSRKSFFTGRYAHTHGVLENGDTPNTGELDLPLILKHYGYETAVSGKLHYWPANFSWGFDKFWSYRDEGPAELETYWQYIKRNNINTKIEEGSCPYPNDPLGKDIGKYTFKKEELQTYWITDRSIEYLKSRKESDKPFFLFTSFLEPHSPSRTTEPYFSMYDPNNITAPNISDEIKKERAIALEKNIKGPSRHLVDNEEMVRRLTAIYLSHVTQVDDNIGRLMSTIKELGLDKNTIIVFTADHGNMLGDLGLWFKGVMYEGSTRIPLIMKMPENKSFANYRQTGITEEHLVENIDVMPTLLELAGIEIPLSIEGTSMVPLLNGMITNWSEDVYAERNSMMYRTVDYKLIKMPGNKGNVDHYEFYDMKNDPKELINLIGNSKYKEI
ncbi:MAG: sulfatase-like hydrolase/transferase, partial [Bacteroidia bacterium]|nr:sulfatase-like hydrolase/transferase [Bacteroidia bacterium]